MRTALFPAWALLAPCSSLARAVLSMMLRCYWEQALPGPS